MSYELRIKDSKTIAAMAAIVLLGWLGFIIFRSPLGDSKEVVINEGQGVYAIADVLEEGGVIENKFVFIVYTLITGNETKLQAGRYVFEPGTTIPIVVYSMARGLAESNDTAITIPEGFNVFDIDKRLSSLGLIGDSDFVKKYYGDEGYFFPDTYRLRKSQTTRLRQGFGGQANHKSQINFNEQNQKQDGVATELANKMLANFKSQTAEAFEDLSVEKQKEIMVIASILEKEAKTEEDMRLVAGVIENRLARGMLLQIDATVSYGVCVRNIEMSKYQNVEYCDVSQIGVANEIKIDGPYNTYTRAELPPGPIANPGITAIQAVLNPTQSDYLYYLSTRDGGQIIFSKTAAEHAANRRKHLGL